MKYFDKEKIIEILKEVIHPDLNKNLVELNMIKDIAFNDGTLSFSIVFFSAPAPIFAKKIKDECINILKQKYNDQQAYKITVCTMQGDIIEVNPLPNVKQKIAILSGKGGVGKSTITVNLAIALTQKGFKVGLIDADIFGPSIPKMLNIEGARPIAETIDGKDFIIPIENFGIKILSIGLFVSDSQSVVWRGPLAGRALKQMINEAYWGELDFLLFDMPPGTSDIQLSLSETIEMTGAIVVTTPQDISFIDAAKAIDMCHKVNITVLGVVENMAWFTPLELPDNKYFIFGKNGGKRLSEKFNVPLLCQIPLIQSVREGADTGEPEYLKENGINKKYFDEIIDKVIISLFIV